MATSIQWTDDTLNVITGCTRIAEGCRGCYAERLTATRLSQQERYKGLAVMSPSGPRWTGEIRLHEDKLLEPLKWRRKESKRNPGGRHMVFLNDMSDTFHEDVPFDFIESLFAIFALTPWVQWQVLTKRPERMAEFFQSFTFASLIGDGRTQWKTLADNTSPLSLLAQQMSHEDQIRDRPDAQWAIILPEVWPLKNVALGTSIATQADADKNIPELLKCPARVRFLSCEPLIGAVKFGPLKGAMCACPNSARGCPACMDVLYGLDWVIVGGESGPQARPFNIEWARSIRDQCKAAGVAYFLKQLGKRIALRNDSASEWPNDGDGLIWEGNEGPSFQGETEIARLEDSHGGEMNEWPEDLRVREFPESFKVFAAT